jgi:hypothetical protein
VHLVKRLMEVPGRLLVNIGEEKTVAALTMT